MLHFVKWDAPILPVHDSFISHHGYESDLNDVMSDAFEQQYGVKAKIKLEEKKYVRLRNRDEGDNMTMESILAHFDEYGDIYGRGASKLMSDIASPAISARRAPVSLTKPISQRKSSSISRHID